MVCLIHHNLIQVCFVKKNTKKHLIKHLERNFSISNVLIIPTIRSKLGVVTPTPSPPTQSPTRPVYLYLVRSGAGRRIYHSSSCAAPVATNSPPPAVSPARLRLVLPRSAVHNLIKLKLSRDEREWIQDGY